MRDPFAAVVPFVHVAEARSFREAARRLQVSPSAVSKAVARLERDLGVPLVNRTSRSVTLTAEGAGFFEQSRDVVARMEEARRLVTSAQVTPRGSLRVSVPLALGHLVLTPRLPAFLARYPEVVLDVSYSDRPVDLVEENFDVAIRIGTPRDSTLVARQVRPARYLTTASPGYLARAGVPSRPADLARHACLTFRLSSGVERDFTFRRGRTVEAIPVPARATFDLGEALVEAARAGGGIVQTLDFMVAAPLRAGELVEVLPRYAPPPGPPISVVFPRLRQLLPKVRVFVDFAVEALADPATYRIEDG